MKLSKDKVDEIFKAHNNETDVLLALYDLVIPDWDNVVKVNGFPSAGEEVHRYIGRSFMDFDAEHHSDTFKGVLWLNNGFSVDRKLKPWEISIEGLDVEYQKEGNA